MAKKKTIKDKQRAKLKAARKKERESKELTEGIIYKCTECGKQEYIPEDVVEYFDMVDDGDVNEPPTFSCESCGAIMRPKHYHGVHDITYEF